LKVPLDALNIPDLTTTATDQEIEAAWEYLCRLQKNLRALQNDISRNSKIVYDKYAVQKRKTCLRTEQGMKWEGGKEAVVVEKSRKIMKDLSLRRENLIKDPKLLTQVDPWRLK
jgi:hypothetical protein